MIATLALTAALAISPAAADDCQVTGRSTCVYATAAPLTVAPVMSIEARRSFAPAAKDLEGWMPSLYRGIHWDPKWKDIRACIMKRESNFRYKAANKTSSARGAYQFLDNNWRDGLVWMMIAESKKTGDGLVNEAKKLRKKPIHKWNRYWQDRAFYTALRNGKGLHHWRHQVPGTGCF
jgi:hypothetical protein